MFNKGGSGDGEGIKTQKAKLFEDRKTPLPDTGNRYHIRIKALNGIQERHVSNMNNLKIFQKKFNNLLLLYLYLYRL